MENTHPEQDSSELSTAELITIFVVFSAILIFFGDTFTATIGIIAEGIIFAVAYNQKHKLID
jgi:hypothetical protein